MTQAQSELSYAIAAVNLIRMVPKIHHNDFYLSSVPGIYQSSQGTNALKRQSRSVFHHGSVFRR